MYSSAEQEIKTRTGSSKLSEVEVGRGRELGWNKDCVYFLVMKQMRNWAQLIIGEELQLESEKDDGQKEECAERKL